MNEIFYKLIFAIIVSLALLKFSNLLVPKYYTIRYISGYYSFQLIAIFFYLLVDIDAKIWADSIHSLYLRDYIDEGIMGYLLFQSGVFIACLFGKFVFRFPGRQIGLVDRIKMNKKTLKAPLLFSALIVLGYPFISFLPGIGYANAILFNFTLFVPFIAGVLYFHDKQLRIIWIIVLSVMFVMGILTGGRGTAMTSAALYTLGFYYALESRRAKRIALAAGAVILIPLMSFIAFVGIYRHIVGRVDFKDLTWERTVRIYEKYQKIKDSKVLNLDSAEGRLNGWGRFINYVNFTEFATVPVKKDHLGVEGLFDTDLKYSFDVSFLSGTTMEDRIRARFGNFKLNDYGYIVNESTSVEYSIVTESYIRFGFWGVFVFACIFTFFALALEYLMLILSSGFLNIQIFATIMVCQQALLGYAYNLFVIMRNMIIAAFIAFVLIIIIMLLKHLFFNPSVYKTAKVK